MKDWRRDLVGIIAVGGFVTVCILLLIGSVIEASMKELALVLLGQISMKFGTVVDYYYGSSAGSSAKDQTISDMSKKP